MKQTAIVFAFLWSLTSQAEAVEPFPDNCKLELQASLPFYLHRGHIMIEAAVNDRPLHFMIDTGGLYSAISQTTFAALGLKRSYFGPALGVQDANGAKGLGFTRV